MSVENTLCKYQTEKAEGEDREAILLFSSLWYGLQALNLNANASQYININCIFFSKIVEVVITIKAYNEFPQLSEIAT